MMVPYALRLVCLSLATFFLVNAFFSLLVSATSRVVIQHAKKMQARSGAWLLLGLRLLPATAGIVTVLALCVPSYLWLEPESISERVGWECFALVFCALTSLTVAIGRGARAVGASLRLRRKWQRMGHAASLPEEPSCAVVVKGETPLLALTGILRPRLFLSESVARALAAEELEVALSHENAHRISRDNLKRLLLLLAPPGLPALGGFARLERAWAEVSEWAADDEAAQGDAGRAVALASALLGVARLGIAPKLSFLHTSLVTGGQELATRVERLLNQGAIAMEAPRRARSRGLLVATSATACAGLLVCGPAALSAIHRLLEFVVH